ncbi:MAG: SUMF1/EgtB/PvdO family nonheme iron enzyme [Hyphomonas sp.]|nr:SUMF1/EgtB/PvdO family nonheme iron enzyme [Hyphomonas sp.]
MRLFRAVRLMLMSFAASVCALSAVAETRLALVIDQTDYIYPTELPRVVLAASEARAIEAALQDTGFTITRKSNLKGKDLVDALDGFRLEVEAAARRDETIAVVYYTGHGAQHPQSRSSYLLGTDARLRGASDLASYGVAMEDQRNGFSATGATAVVLIFDACRNIPGGSGWKSGTKGIGRVDAATDMLIAYSTSLDDVAKEGVYAPILAEEIRRPGVSVAALFDNVQVRVAEVTGRIQRPWYNSQLYNRVCLAGCAPAASTVVAVSSRPAPTPLAPVSTSRRVGEAFRGVFTSGSGKGPEMVVLPSGSFMMGSPTSEAGRTDDEGPQRTVRIGYEFAVGKYEVTSGQYSACVSAGACPAARDDGYGQQGTRPVTYVSWEEARKYASWLSGQTGQTYRLLTEAEWEYAARAGSDARWSFGGDESRLGAFGWYLSNSSGRTQPVGGKGANAFGLHDLHGNVWEWVEDCYEAGYSEQPLDGSSFTKSSCYYRVIRGGSGDNTPQILRSAYRSRDAPDVRGYFLGFRLARALP